MTKMRYQYLWRKQASVAWSQTNETELLRHFTERVAIIEQPERKRCTVEICCAQRREAERLSKQFGGRIEEISQLPSVARSKSLKIGPRLIVTDRQSGRAFFGRRHLVIPAEAAFGTGDHATTAMSLRLMERITRTWTPGWSLLDAGTGTGILALAGRLFGARNVTAIDNDPVAITIAKRNAIRNRIRHIRFRVGDAMSLRSRTKFHIVAANLYSEVLIAALPAFVRILRPGGLLILSGILREQELPIVRILRRTKMVPIEIRRRGKWIALLSTTFWNSSPPHEQKAG
jgi:ribosomal protein L11 methyltransferase